METKNFFNGRSSNLAILGLVFLGWQAGGELSPIALTPESFNQDIVVERGAPGPVRPATSATMEGGRTNIGYTFYEKGYQLDWPVTGLPVAGGIINSDLAMDHEYRFAPDYRTNNVVLISGTESNGELRLVPPRSCAALSVLLTGSNDRQNVPVSCRIVHQDGLVETNSILCPDWMDSTPSACSGNGRINVNTLTYSHLNTGLPRLYQADVTVTNTSPVVRVEFGFVRGSGQCAIFALSSASESGGAFSPLSVSGYNADVVMEAAADHVHELIGFTTATMQNGMLNSMWTWFERGYAPALPESGLPAAGTLVTNASSPGCVFRMPPVYDTNNAAVLDADSRLVKLTPMQPAAVRTLCLLCASFSGPLTNVIVAQHADGTGETNWLVAPDWADASTPPAVEVNGRVNINTRIADGLGASRTRLFAAEMALTNSSVPVTNVLLKWMNGAGQQRVAVFAMSGAGAAQPAEPAVLWMESAPDGSFILKTSAAGRLQSTTMLGGSWEDLGPITGQVLLPAPSAAGARFYRVVRP